jgi:Mg/Co/Ni transporter MgtE
MKNIYLSEISDPRETICFPINASLKDLLIPLMENWRIHHFYLVDDQNRLQGVLKKSRLLEFLTPIYCLVERDFNPVLDDRLSQTRASDLLDKTFPRLLPNQTLPEAMALFIEHDQDYLPLVDKKDRFRGEISTDNLLKLLPAGHKEHLYAV